MEITTTRLQTSAPNREIWTPDRKICVCADELIWIILFCSSSAVGEQGPTSSQRLNESGPHLMAVQVSSIGFLVMGMLVLNAKPTGLQSKRDSCVGIFWNFDIFFYQIWPIKTPNFHKFSKNFRNRHFCRNKSKFQKILHHFLPPPPPQGCSMSIFSFPKAIDMKWH